MSVQKACGHERGAAFLAATFLRAGAFFFLAATLAVGICNYVPTRFAIAAITALLVVAGWFAILLEPSYADVTPLKGIYSGEGSTDLDVVVEITRLA